MRPWSRAAVIAGAVLTVYGIPARASHCVSTGAKLDFGRYPIGATVRQAGVPSRLVAACATSESCGFRDQGVEYVAEAYESGVFIARKELDGAALDAWGSRNFGWRTGDTVADAQAKFRRVTGKTLQGGLSETREILLHDVCARGPYGEYQFYASFGTDGQLRGIIVRIDSPYG